MAGTLHYMAPEVHKQNYDQACDIWSIGVITYLLFSQGELPFPGESQPEVFNSIRRHPVYLPEESESPSSNRSRYDW